MPLGVYSWWKQESPSTVNPSNEPSEPVENDYDDEQEGEYEEEYTDQNGNMAEK